MNAVQSLSYRQIRVGEHNVGISGLEESFQKLHERRVAPDQGSLRELLAAVREHNYIPAATEADYAAALLRAYQVFCQDQTAAGSGTTGYGTWRGQQRETIPWYPVISAGRCDGCGACLRFCPNGVFAASEEQVVRVVEPYRCQVGCSACVRVCKPGAIAFPPQGILKAFAKR